MTEHSAPRAHAVQDTQAVSSEHAAHPDAPTAMSPHDAMGHGGHGSMSMEGMVRDMRRRFLVAAALSIPILLWSPIGREVFGFSVPAPFGLRDDVANAVATAAASYPGSGVMSVPSVPLAPRLTDDRAAELGISQRLSAFTQEFPYAAYRVQNIGQAARYVNGTLLMPGETFSMNDTIKERTRANGYTEGFVIGPGGVFREELGGGVSAATTAVWTAAFFAGMEPVHVQAHSIYIPRYAPGLEATVA